VRPSGPSRSSQDRSCGLTGVPRQRAGQAVVRLLPGAHGGRADRLADPFGALAGRLKRLAGQAGVPVVKLHEGGRHTGNSLMYDADVRQDIVMRQVGHASAEISQRYNHPLRQAHLAAGGQVAALVRKAGKTG
jgi:integrase